MKAMLLLYCVLFPVLSQAQAKVTTVRIRVLNGRKGGPVKQANTTVTITPGGPYTTPLSRKTDGAGRFSLLVEDGAELHILVLRHPTCRTVAKADRKKQSVGYSVQQILAHGTVSENGCSKRTVAPTPGELTLFVRPMHWLERTAY